MEDQLLPPKTEEPTREARRRTLRQQTFDFLEAKTARGLYYEVFTIGLICLNVLTFMLGTDKVINHHCADTFGDRNITSDDSCEVFQWVEVFTVSIFTIEYIVRVWASVEDEAYNHSRCRWMVSWWSFVDLVSIVPFYVDLMLPQDLPSSQFLRLMRLFRMMRVEGRFLEAFTMFDDVFTKHKDILATTGFVGVAVWIILASLYYLAEKNNDQMDGKFSSIPSASYYTLCNLFGEFPEADNHSTWGKIIGVFIQVVAVAVFGIPTAIMGDGFQGMVEEKRQKDKDNAEEAPEERKELPPLAQDSQFQVDLWKFLHAKSRNGEFFELAINWLIALNVLCFLLNTVDAITEHHVVDQLLDGFEAVSVVIFTVEYLLRVYAAGTQGDGVDNAAERDFRGLAGKLRFLVSFYALVDLISVAPWYINLMLGNGTGNGSTFVRVLRLVRMLKADQYVNAFTQIDDIIGASKGVLMVTGFAAIVMWIFFSTLMYFTEFKLPGTANNQLLTAPDLLTVGADKCLKGIFGPPPDMPSCDYPVSADQTPCELNECADIVCNCIPYERYVYRSVPAAMWITLLNLTGEVPLDAYTSWGKLINGIIGIVAVGSFSIPVGLLGAGFESWIEEKEGENEEEEEDQDEVISVSDADSTVPPEGSNPTRWNLLRFLDGKTTWGFRFEMFILALILLSVTYAVVSTLNSVGEPTSLQWCEGAVVVIFTLEYLARLYAIAESHEYADCQYPRLNYLISFYALVDLLAILPWYLQYMFQGTGFGDWMDDHDKELRMFRMLRLFKLDKYVPSITLIDDACRKKAYPLKITCFVATVFWIIFASLLYLTEKDDQACTNPDPSDSYPQSDDAWVESSVGWKWPATQAVCASNGLQSTRFQNVPNAMTFTMFLLTGDYPLTDFSFWGKAVNFFMILFAVSMVAIPSGLLASGFQEVIEEDAEKRAARDSKKKKKKKEASNPDEPQPSGNEMQKAVYLFVNGRGDWDMCGCWLVKGSVFHYSVAVLIVLNVISVILESEDSIRNADGMSTFFDTFEWISVVIFTVEFFLRLYSAVEDPRADYSRIGYMTSFFGVVDILAIFPCYVEGILSLSGVHFNAMIFRVFRVFRVLLLEHFTEAFTLLDDAFRSCKDTMAATGLLALVIWVGCATLFYIFESSNDNPEYVDAFSNIPNSMYYVAVFLGGEWAKTDFTIPGKLVAQFLALCGIALYAIPIGAFFEAFGDLMGVGDDDDDEEEEAEADEGQEANPVGEQEGETLMA